MGQLHSFFSATSAVFLIHRRCLSNQPFLLLLMIYVSYAANYNTKGAFVIIFLICRSKRSVGTIFVIIEMAKTATKSFSLRKFSPKQWKQPFFAVLMYSLYSHPRNFKLKRKYQQYSPCFLTIFPFLVTLAKSVNISCFVAKLAMTLPSRQLHNQS